METIEEAPASIEETPEEISEDELVDLIRTLTPKQQEVIKLTSEGTASIPELARKADLATNTIGTWLYNHSDARAMGFQIAFKAVRALRTKNLPTMAVAMAKAASTEAMRRDVEAATAPNPDTAAMLTAVGHRRDTIYKAAGLLSTDASQVTIIGTINNALIAKPRPPEPWLSVEAPPTVEAPPASE